MCCILELVDLFNFCELFQTVLFSAFHLNYIIFNVALNINISNLHVATTDWVN